MTSRDEPLPPDAPTPLWLLALQMGMTIDQVIDVLERLGWIERVGPDDFVVKDTEALVPIFPQN